MQDISREAVIVYRDPLITKQMSEAGRPEGRKFSIENSILKKRVFFYINFAWFIY
jgi:hypothetical protein